METRPFQAHELPVLSLAFSPDSQTLATGSSDETIQLWEVATSVQKLKSFDGQIGPVCSISFSPDGKFLASGGRDSPVRFWHLEDAGSIDLITDLKSDKSGNFAFSPEASLMAGGCLDNTVRIWDVATLKEQYRLTNASYVVAFTSDGKKLLASTADGIACWWDFRAGGKQSVPQYAGLAQVTSANLSPDRRVAAVGSGDGAIQLLEIDSGKILDTYRGHTDAVTAVAFAPGGTRFVSGSRDKTVRLWDVKNPEQSLKTWSEHQGAVGGVAISTDGTMMVSGCGAGAIKFWDLRHPGKSLASINWHRSAIRSLAFSPDNKILASGGEDKSVKLWDFASRRQLGSFQFDDAIRLVAFSPDGNNLAVVTDNGTLRLLRAMTLPEADEENRTFYSVGGK
jgi:WD40 repeat protein